MKSVTEKGFPASLNYAVTRGKGEFSFRFSQLVTAASYSEADVSARPNSLNLFLPTFVGNSALFFIFKTQKVFLFYPFLLENSPTVRYIIRYNNKIQMYFHMKNILLIKADAKKI